MIIQIDTSKADQITVNQLLHDGTVKTQTVSHESNENVIYKGETDNENDHAQKDKQGYE